jgi:hypothetical protein
MEDVWDRYEGGSRVDLVNWNIGSLSVLSSRVDCCSTKRRGCGLYGCCVVRSW